MTYKKTTKRTLCILLLPAGNGKSSRASYRLNPHGSASNPHKIRAVMRKLPSNFSVVARLSLRDDSISPCTTYRPVYENLTERVQSSFTRESISRSCGLFMWD